MFVKLATVFCLGSMLCLADTWNGKLVDASCKDQIKPATSQSTDPQPQSSTCEPTSSTTSFGLELQDGRVLKLDSTGSAKAAEALKSNTTKSSMNVTVTGSLDGKTVKVDSINIQ